MEDHREGKGRGNLDFVGTCAYTMLSPMWLLTFCVQIYYAVITALFCAEVSATIAICWHLFKGNK